MNSSNAANKSERPPVLLMDGGIATLSVARSLGTRGIPVYCLDIQQNFARFSRFSKRIPFKLDKQADWLQWLTAEGAKSYGGAVIFPCSDNVLEMVAKHRAELENHFILPEANDPILLAMLDKAETYPLAEGLGVPVPRTWVVNKRSDIEAILDQVPYPCALKPRYSHEFRGLEFLKKYFIVKTPDELLGEFDHLQEFGTTYGVRSDLIVTEIIPGEAEDQFQSYYSYLDEHGEPLIHFTKRKLRQYPNDSGNGTYHMTDWNPEVAELGLRFFKGIGFRGIGAVEFKRDPRDGQLKLMECNARLTTATELLRHSGFDLSYFIYNRLTGRPLPEMNGYRQGARMIRLVRDFLAFRDAQKRGLMTWGQWLQSVMHKQHFEAFDLSDPLPWVMMGVYFINRERKMFHWPKGKTTKH